MLGTKLVVITIQSFVLFILNLYSCSFILYIISILRNSNPLKGMILWYFFFDHLDTPLRFLFFTFFIFISLFTLNYRISEKYIWRQNSKYLYLSIFHIPFDFILTFLLVFFIFNFIRLVTTTLRLIS